MDLHAITLRNQWAQSIIHGPKRVENRNYPINIWSGGNKFSDVWLAIHVSSALKSEDKIALRDIQQKQWPAIKNTDLQKDLRRIIGLMHVSKVTKDYQEAVDHQAPGHRDWVMSRSRYYWLIDKVIPLEKPTKETRGFQKCWKIKDKEILEYLQNVMNDSKLQKQEAKAHENSAATTGKENQPQKQTGNAEEKDNENDNDNDDDDNSKQSKNKRKSLARGDSPKRKKQHKNKKKSKSSASQASGSGSTSYEWTAEDCQLAFHIINETGSGSLSRRDLVNSAKKTNVDLTEDEADRLIDYANTLNPNKSKARSGVVSMEGFMAVSVATKLCPPQSTS
mmetsp:Transcript_25555/g.45395  ORF Transcript_25555/g.45395 Transcript_25555/m.45395 type:complete len:336 (+) Transcript_25555:21-1028(+)